MKNLSIFLSLLFSLSLFMFSSCGDDDSASGPVVSNANLEGTLWVQASRTAADCANSSNNENTTCDSECDAILLNNGFVEIADDDGIFAVPFTKNGSNLMVDIGQGNMLDITYAIVGNTLTTTFVEDSCNITEVYTASQSSVLVGTTWVKVGERQNNCTDPNDNCDPCSIDTQTILLAADGTGVNTNSNGTQAITYTTNGNMITVEYDDNGQTVTLELEYKIVGEILVLEYTEDNGCDIAEIYRGS